MYFVERENEKGRRGTERRGTGFIQQLKQKMQGLFKDPNYDFFQALKLSACNTNFIININATSRKTTDALTTANYRQNISSSTFKNQLTNYFFKQCSSKFKDFSSTFKDLPCFQALASALNFKN